MILLGFSIILPNQALALKLNKIAIKRYIRYTMRKLYYTLFLVLFLQVGISFGQEWQVVSQMPIPVSGAVAFTRDSLIYIYGGHNSRYFTTPALLQIYDPQNNQWKVDTIGTFSNSRYGGTGGFWDGNAYFFGGPLDSVATNMDVWNLQGDSQLATTRQNDNFKRHFARSEIVHGKIYCFGGYWNNINANDRPLLPYIFIYDIASHGLVTITPFFDITLVWNRGISYGLFQQDSEIGRYLLIAIILCIILVVMVWLTRASGYLVAIAMGLVLGGAMGNVIDRKSVV